MMKLGALMILFFALTVTMVARADDQGQSSQNVASSQLQRRAYPGGRDESDLTVQPHKTVTRKQVDSEAGFEAEPEVDSSGADEGFGE